MRFKDRVRLQGPWRRFLKRRFADPHQLRALLLRKMDRLAESTRRLWQTAALHRLACGHNRLRHLRLIAAASTPHPGLSRKGKRESACACNVVLLPLREKERMREYAERRVNHSSAQRVPSIAVASKNPTQKAFISMTTKELFPQAAAQCEDRAAAPASRLDKFSLPRRRTRSRR